MVEHTEEKALQYARERYPPGTKVRTIAGMSAIRTIAEDTKYLWQNDGRILVKTVEKGDCNYSMTIWYPGRGWSVVEQSAPYKMSKPNEMYPIW